MGRACLGGFSEQSAQVGLAEGCTPLAAGACWQVVHFHSGLDLRCSTSATFCRPKHQQRHPKVKRWSNGPLLLMRGAQRICRPFSVLDRHQSVSPSNRNHWDLNFGVRSIQSSQLGGTDTPTRAPYKVKDTMAPHLCYPFDWSHWVISLSWIMQVGMDSVQS